MNATKSNNEGGLVELAEIKVAGNKVADMKEAKIGDDKRKSAISKSGRY